MSDDTATSDQSITARPPAPRGLSRLRMLSDTPLSDERRDFFGYRVYADSLAELIDNEGTDTPLTLAVSAPWGAGKTSLAKMIEHRLNTRVEPGERPTVICWFNAWMHDDAPHLGAAMAAHVAKTASRNRAMLRRILEPLPSAMLSSRERWRRRLLIGLAAAGLAVAILSIAPVRELAESFSVLKDREAAQAGSTTAALILLVLLGSRLFSGLEHAARFFDDPASEAAQGSIWDVRSQLGRLIGQAVRGRRLVVFVDDLERCTPERAVEVCEVANQLLSHEGVVTVFIADMHVIAKSAEEQYGSVTSGGNAGRRYLEKIVQLQLTLPPPKAADMERLLSGRGSGLADHDPEETESEEHRASRPLFPPVPTLIFRRLAREPLVAVPTFVLGAFGGFRFGASSMIVSQPEPSRPRTELERVFGLPAEADFSDIVLAGGMAPYGALALSAIAVAATQAYRRARTREKRKRINEIIREKINRGTDQDALEEVVVGTVNKKDRDIARKLVRSYLVDYADELRGVEEVILRYPPRLPRGAKRMLNHARLLTQIARARKLFGGEPPLTPAHLGEWIVICERWPLIAEQIENDPQVLKRLESLAADGRGALAPKLDGLDESDVTAIYDLLTQEPRLGDVAVRLARFEPASPQISPSAAGVEAASTR